MPRQTDQPWDWCGKQTSVGGNACDWVEFAAALDLGRRRGRQRLRPLRLALHAASGGDAEEEDNEDETEEEARAKQRMIAGQQQSSPPISACAISVFGRLDHAFGYSI